APSERKHCWAGSRASGSKPALRVNTTGWRPSMRDTLRRTSRVSEVDQARRIGRAFRGPRCVVFVVNNDRSFLSHRATWGAALQAAGADITVIAEDTGEADRIRSLGFNFIAVRVGREASSVSGMINSAVLIMVTLLRLRPRLVFLSAQVAYTLGWPAAIL